jgi:hypothetical protein
MSWERRRREINYYSYWNFNDCEICLNHI